MQFCPNSYFFSLISPLIELIKYFNLDFLYNLVIRLLILLIKTKLNHFSLITFQLSPQLQPRIIHE
jgi:hypothetical protein